jgi:hypothetical protein
MAQDSTKVIVPGHGRFWLGPVDTLAPGQVLKITGTPTQATVTLTVATVASAATVLRSTDSSYTKALAIATALAGLSSVGAGNVLGVFPTPDPWTFTIVLDPSVATPAITATATYTGGTTPGLTVSTTGRSADFSAYSEIGHTSSDNPLQMNRSGGDVTTQDSWQASGIDSSQAPVSWSMAYSGLQYDVPTLKLYHGSNANVSADGMVQTNPSGPTATENAMFLAIRNGSKAQIRHVPRVSTIAADGENFDTSKLAELPLQSSFLTSNNTSYGQALSVVGAAA